MIRSNKRLLCKAVLIALMVLYLVLCCLDCMENVITQYADGRETVTVYGYDLISWKMILLAGIHGVLLILDRRVLQAVAGVCSLFSGMMLPLQVEIHNMMNDVQTAAILPTGWTSSGDWRLTTAGYCVTVLAWLLLAAQIVAIFILKAAARNAVAEERDEVSL